MGFFGTPRDRRKASKPPPTPARSPNTVQTLPPTTNFTSQPFIPQQATTSPVLQPQAQPAYVSAPSTPSTGVPSPMAQSQSPLQQLAPQVTGTSASSSSHMQNPPSPPMQAPFTPHRGFFGAPRTSSTPSVASLGSGSNGFVHGNGAGTQSPPLPPRQPAYAIPSASKQLPPLATGPPSQVPGPPMPAHTRQASYPVSSSQSPAVAMAMPQHQGSFGVPTSPTGGPAAQQHVRYPSQPAAAAPYRPALPPRQPSQPVQQRSLWGSPRDRTESYMSSPTSPTPSSPGSPGSPSLPSSTGKKTLVTSAGSMLVSALTPSPDPRLFEPQAYANALFTLPADQLLSELTKQRGALTQAEFTRGASVVLPAHQHPPSLTSILLAQAQGRPVPLSARQMLPLKIELAKMQIQMIEGEYGRRGEGVPKRKMEDDLKSGAKAAGKALFKSGLVGKFVKGIGGDINLPNVNLPNVNLPNVNLGLGNMNMPSNFVYPGAGDGTGSAGPNYQPDPNSNMDMGGFGADPNAIGQDYGNGNTFDPGTLNVDPNDVTQNFASNTGMDANANTNTNDFAANFANNLAAMGMSVPDPSAMASNFTQDVSTDANAFGSAVSSDVNAFGSDVSSDMNAFGAGVSSDLSAFGAGINLDANAVASSLGRSSGSFGLPSFGDGGNGGLMDAWDASTDGGSGVGASPPLAGPLASPIDIGSGDFPLPMGPLSIDPTQGGDGGMGFDPSAFYGSQPPSPVDPTQGGGGGAGVDPSVLYGSQPPSPIGSPINGSGPPSPGSAGNGADGYGGNGGDSNANSGNFDVNAANTNGNGNENSNGNGNGNGSNGFFSGSNGSGISLPHVHLPHISLPPSSHYPHAQPTPQTNPLDLSPGYGYTQPQPPPQNYPQQGYHSQGYPPQTYPQQNPHQSQPHAHAQSSHAEVSSQPQTLHHAHANVNDGTLSHIEQAFQYASSTQPHLDSYPQTQPAHLQGSSEDQIPQWNAPASSHLQQPSHLQPGQSAPGAQHQISGHYGQEPRIQAGPSFPEAIFMPQHHQQSSQEASGSEPPQYGQPTEPLYVPQSPAPQHPGAKPSEHQALNYSQLPNYALDQTPYEVQGPPPQHVDAKPPLQQESSYVPRPDFTLDQSSYPSVGPPPRHPDAKPSVQQHSSYAPRPDYTLDQSPLQSEGPPPRHPDAKPSVQQHSSYAPRPDYTLDQTPYGSAPPPPHPSTSQIPGKVVSDPAPVTGPEEEGEPVEVYLPGYSQSSEPPYVVEKPATLFTSTSVNDLGHATQQQPHEASMSSGQGRGHHGLHHAHGATHHGQHGHGHGHAYDVTHPVVPHKSAHAHASSSSHRPSSSSSSSPAGPRINSVTQHHHHSSSSSRPQTATSAHGPPESFIRHQHTGSSHSSFGNLPSSGRQASAPVTPQFTGSSGSGQSIVSSQPHHRGQQPVSQSGYGPQPPVSTPGLNRRSSASTSPVFARPLPSTANAYTADLPTPPLASPSAPSPAATPLTTPTANMNYYSSAHASLPMASMSAATSGPDWAAQKVAQDMRGLKGRLNQYFQVTNPDDEGRLG